MKIYDEKTANYSLPIDPRSTMFGCGIYEAGDSERCYVKLFVTNAGCVIPINHRSISEEDLMQAYQWGYQDGKEDVSS